MDCDDEQPYEPVKLRTRHDGLTPLRQIAFLDALAGSGCIEEACRSAGVSRGAVYALRKRLDGVPFRRAWDAALATGIERLGHAALSRAVNGTARPVFYKGKQIGKRRFYDERLTLFLLRTRDPVRYGKPGDCEILDQQEDGPVGLFAHERRDAERAANRTWDAPAPDPAQASSATSRRRKRRGT